MLPIFLYNNKGFLSSLVILIFHAVREAAFLFHDAININRGFTKFGIKVLWRLQVLEYLRTLHLKFQKAQTKIEVVLSLPCWLSQLNWDSQLGRLRTTSILVRAFWNFKLKVLKYSRNCSLHNTLIPWSLKNTESPNAHSRKYDLWGFCLRPCQIPSDNDAA